MNNLHVKFESNGASGKNCSLYRAYKAKRDGRTDQQTHAPIQPITHERPHYYMPTNAVARG